MAGYSGTPLAKKLGIKEGSEVFPVGAPDGYLKLLEPLPDGVRFATRLSDSTDAPATIRRWQGAGNPNDHLP